MGEVAKMSKLTADILADELENWYPTINLCVYSAKMLRQQQTEIERLNFYIEGLLSENEKLRNQWGHSGMSIPCKEIQKYGKGGGGAMDVSGGGKGA